MERKQLLNLKEKAAHIRKDILLAIASASSGHPGGSLSVTDILTYLYFYKMNIDEKNPKLESRDRFVLSKGHACPALYSALAVRGFFPEDELVTLRKLGSRLQGHPDMLLAPGIDMSTGSLGQGISAACGMALRGKREGCPWRVYTVIGDGESQEGEVWEAAMFASHYNLDNLTLFVDLNRLQIDGDITKVMNPLPLDQKFAAFGWFVQTVDGHDFEQIDAAVSSAEVSGRPSCIICNTVKGKGVSFMENNAGWHGKAPKPAEYEIAAAELEAACIKAKEELENG